jgi:Leucine-rich repeat (LRR) protein
LTSINNIFQNDLNLFDWEVFLNFKNIKAIHFEGGKLINLDSKFGNIFGDNILTAFFDNTKLENIETNVFKKWLKLKMLTINRNLIYDITWISSELPNLWYLDLRFNKLLYVSQDLISKLPSLRVLKLDDNKIRVISFTSIEPLLSINEFSFEKTIGKFINHIILKLIQKFFCIDETEPKYFLPSQQMRWVTRFFNENYKRPIFLYESLYNSYSISKFSRHLVTLSRVIT